MCWAQQRGARGCGGGQGGGRVVLRPSYRSAAAARLLYLLIKGRQSDSL